MRRIVPFTFIVMFFLATALPAQPTWVAAQQDHVLSFEWQKPFLENSEGTNFFLSSFFLGYRTRTSESLTFIVDFPFSNFDTETGSQFLLGNPYVGLAIGSEDALISGDVGVRVPIADEDKGFAALYGGVSDIDRFEAFAVKSVPVVGILRFQTMIPATKFGVRVHAGPSINVYMDDRGDEIMDVYMKYGLIGVYKDEAVLAQLGFSGVYTMRHQFEAREDQGSSQIGLTVNADIGAHFWPGLLLRLPLDSKFGSAVDAVLGVNVMLVL